METLIDTLKLIERSPDIGEGRRTCSGVLWPLITQLPSQLIELQPSEEGGGKVRMTSQGLEVLTYS